MSNKPLPAEPTSKMMDAGYRALFPEGVYTELVTVYKAMWQAAPSPEPAPMDSDDIEWLRNVSKAKALEPYNILSAGRAQRILNSVLDGKQEKDDG